MKTILSLAVLIILIPVGAWADKPRVVDARVEKSSVGFHFSVTLTHADHGWEHYADRWQVLDSTGRVLGERVLLHPHDDEQPFTRSLRDVKVPEGIRMVYLRARDSVHGFGELFGPVPLPER